MQESPDSQLLRDYAENGDEEAFREIVSRYTDLVYSAALRQLESSDLAADITQSVFVDLARKARLLSAERSHPTSVVGWLHRATRYAALNHLRDSQRRVAIERQAMEQLLTDSESSVNWEKIRPALDEALDELDADDREALLLRYFKNQDLRTVGRAFGVSDDAAQKRVSRAIERLREFFNKRGVAVGTSGLAIVISANAVQAAPGGLALTISTVAITASTVSTSTAIATTHPILMTAIQKTLITATIAAVVAGTAIYQATQNHRLRDQIESLRQHQAALESDSNSNALSNLQNQVEQLSQQNAELTSLLAKADANSTRLSAAKQQAERTAGLYQQLADQAAAKNASSTNDYPTQRHVFVGFGKLVRQMVDFNSQDQSKLTPKEKAASNEMKANLLHDFMSLAALAGQYDDNEKSPDNPAGTDVADNAADTMTSLLYGAIGLSEQQYGSIFNILQKYQRQAADQNLFSDQAGDNATSALKQLNEDARKEVQPLLTGDQTKVFEEILPSIQLVTRKLNITFGGK